MVPKRSSTNRGSQFRSATIKRSSPISRWRKADHNVQPKSHDDIIQAGFVLGADGAYHKPAHVLTGNPRAPAKLEHDSGNGAMGQIPVQAAVGRRFLVHVTSYRKRLLDQDNLCCKYLVDLCRYAGILPSDAPGTAEIKVSQQKVGPKEPERTIIEIFPL